MSIRAPFRFILALSVIMLCPGCGSGVITARDALVAAKTFIDALSILETTLRLYQSQVTVAVQSTKENLNQPNSDRTSSAVLPKAALNWEDKWKAVAERTLALEQQFEDVKKASEKYWHILEQVTDNIQDEGIRKTEKAKNEAAKAQWDRAYQAASKQIAATRALRDKGNDIGRIMLAAALRGQLAEYTNTLDSIAKEAERLIASLENIIQQGKLIVGSTKQ
jgi:hypothetical protein